MTVPPTRCEYQWPEDADVDFPVPDSFMRPHHCCWRETWEDSDRCIWHAETDAEKPTDELERRRETPENLEHNRGGDRSAELLDGAYLPGVGLGMVGSFRGCSLQYADLSGADLMEADLPGADLFKADLPGADLFKADLTDADLRFADLSGADLRGADLSGADLRGADLSGADLRRADLPGANLREADLSGADLREADLSDAKLAELSCTDVTLSRGTTFLEQKTYAQRVREGVVAVRRSLDPRSSERDPAEYDTEARTYGELRRAYSANGLLGRARKARVRERRARRREAKAEGGVGGTGAWFLSLLSEIFTGYGVRLLPVVGWMLVLYVGSTVVYWQLTDWGVRYSLYYSIVTFTTAPPELPPSGIPAIVASIETFAGTAAIIFLGYVLGSRERI